MLQRTAGSPLATRRELNAGEIGHISPDDVRELIAASGTNARTIKMSERNGLLIAVLFDACLRVSEALRLTPADFRADADGWTVHVTRKGGAAGDVALSASLVARLHSYAYTWDIPRDGQLFPFNRTRAFKIVKDAFETAGIPKPDHVGHVHVLRHSGALWRLEQTGNPRALQAQLGHSQMAMTLRYMTTLQTRDAIKIQQGVDYGW